MNFTFTEDQKLFQQSVADFMRAEITPEYQRQQWASKTGRSDSLWQQLAELGLTGMLVDEQYGGLGLSAVDMVLLAQEAGYVALSEPCLNSAMIAAPVLAGSDNDALCKTHLPQLVAGKQRIIYGGAINGLCEDAHCADLLLLEHESAIYALTPEQVTLREQASVDPGRKLFAVDFDIEQTVLLAGGDAAARLMQSALNHGALSVAAQALGLAQRMLDMSVAYTTDRKQFGVPIGSFQAVKHHMANIAWKLEYARAPVYRAAYALAHKLPSADRDISHAKLVACEVADLAAQNSIQVHGAMGYTWEVDLHIFMKRAWALTNSWGTPGFHKRRIAGAVLADAALLGAGHTFACAGHSLNLTGSGTP